MDIIHTPFVRVGPLSELRRLGSKVVSSPGGPVLVIADGKDVIALDNRCPHMGFPLHRGSIEDGILTCHWHHARFDLRTGCTFDLWADDVPTRAVRIVDGEVSVAAHAEPRDEAGHWRHRLGHGLAHNIRLIIAKAVIGARAAGVSSADLVRQAMLFGACNRPKWGSGLTTLIALANLLPGLDDHDRGVALIEGIGAVAEDCEGEPPFIDGEPLAGAPPLNTLARWFRQWVRVRHTSAAERTLRTAIDAGVSPGWLAATLLVAATDRYFADGGHALDFLNKAFEGLDLIGWQHAAQVLSTIVPVLTESRGREEADNWRHPVDLIALAEESQPRISDALERGRSARGRWNSHAGLAQDFLGDDPNAILDSLIAAVSDGAAPADVARAVALAGARRIAYFGTNNEQSDWDVAHHTFSYANATYRLLERADEGDAATEALGLRAAVHGALAVYLNRYLNVPPARLPRDEDLTDPPQSTGELRSLLLDAYDRQHQVEAAARLAARYLAVDESGRDLVAALGHALLREDAGFHMVLNLEAAVRQFQAWHAEPEAASTLIGAARYLGAHSPTRRAKYQVAEVARRLMSGSIVSEDAEAG
jgi:nitrite reductase/ring-hydroxylating ferredoxin subunit